MLINKLLRPPLVPIYDSVGKICTDKLTSAGTRQDPAFAAREAAYSSSACEEQEHETRGRSKDCCSFPLHMQVLLIVLGPSFAERRCTDMLTEFTNRVIYRAHRRFIGLCRLFRYPGSFIKLHYRPWWLFRYPDYKGKKHEYAVLRYEQYIA